MIEGGSLFDPKILDIKDDDLLSHVTSAISQVAAVSLELGYPTLASIPHSLINGYKNVLAVAVETDYSFDLADKVIATSSEFPCTAFSCWLSELSMVLHCYIEKRKTVYTSSLRMLTIGLPKTQHCTERAAMQ